MQYLTVGQNLLTCNFNMGHILSTVNRIRVHVFPHINQQTVHLKVICQVFIKSLFLEAGAHTSFGTFPCFLLLYFSSSISIPFYRSSSQSLVLKARNRAADVGQFGIWRKPLFPKIGQCLKILLCRYWFIFLVLFSFSFNLAM